MHRGIKQSVGLLVLPCLLAALMPGRPCQATQIWTLERSLQRAIDISPETREAQAGIQMRQGELQQAGEWPNPTVSLRTQNRMGLQDNTGGYNVDQLMVSQPLPLWRIKHQSNVATKQLAAEEAAYDASQLAMHADVARLYSFLLFNHEKSELADQRLIFTDGIAHKPVASEPVIQYISPIDRHRIELLHETTHQNAREAQASYDEAVTQFRTRLAIDSSEPIDFPNMEPAAKPKPLAELEKSLDARAPTLQQLRSQLEAGQAGVDLEHAKVFGDPVVSMFYERDVLGGRRQAFNGIMVSVPVPLWDRNEGNIAKAEAQVQRTESQIEIVRRTLDSQLKQAHMQLTHLLEQLSYFRQSVVEPADHLLALTRRSYEVGELGSLSLIDAYNTYFDARSRYLDLVYQSRLKAIDLQQLAGEPILKKLKPAGLSE